MPGRQFTSGSYRYGFNNKEKDDEVKGAGNSVDFGDRISDTRLGKFLSVDPLTNKYASYSPYLYAGNKPVWCIDIGGAGEGTYDSPQSEWERATWIIGTWNQAKSGLGDAFLMAYSYIFALDFQGKNIRASLEEQGYHVESTITNEALGRAFEFKMDDGKVTIRARSGWKETLLDFGIGVLDASSVISLGSGKYGANLLCVQISPAAKMAVADMLRIIKINARRTEILASWVDSRTGGTVRESEASAFAIFEEFTGSKLRPSGFYEAGDAIATAGKYAGKSIEHMGGYKPGANDMIGILTTLGKHIEKADILLLDLRNFSKEEKQVILDVITKNYSKQLSKIIKIE